MSHTLFWIRCTLALVLTDCSPIPEPSDASDIPTAIATVIRAVPEPTSFHTERARMPGESCSPDSPCTAGYHCDDSDARGFCTRACTPFATHSSDAQSCLAENATCVAIGDAIGYCAPTCDSTRVDSCGRGRVCTNYSWVESSHGAPGCFPFCRHEGDCAPDAHCNTRTGQCAARTFDPSLAPDGTPCSPRDGDPFCRGFCWNFDPTSVDRGLCASLVDRGSACPDAPERIVALSALNDGVSLCAYRTCSDRLPCDRDTNCVRSALGDLCLPR